MWQLAPNLRSPNRWLGKSLRTAALAFVTAHCLWAGSPSRPQPSVSIDLRQFGVRFMSNADYAHGDRELRALRSYDLRIRMIEAWDFGVKAEFISDRVLVVYHTRNSEDNNLAGHEPQRALQLEALFFDAENGAFIRKEAWPTRVRVGGFEAEARIFPVHTGQFIVCALDKLMLYGTDYSLLHEKQLQTLHWGDYRRIQVLPTGHQLFLDEKLSGHQKYSRLDVDSLQPLNTPADLLDPNWGDTASEHDLYPSYISPGFQARASWPPKYQHATLARKYHITDCPMSSFPLDQEQVLWKGDCGFTVDQGSTFLWERRIVPEGVYAGSEGFTVRNLCGNEFVLGYAAFGRWKLDNVRLSKNGTWLVYDVPSRKVIFSVDQPGNVLALSPDGSKLAAMNGRMNIYKIR